MGNKKMKSNEKADLLKSSLNLNKRQNLFAIGLIKDMKTNLLISVLLHIVWFLLGMYWGIILFK